MVSHGSEVLGKTVSSDPDASGRQQIGGRRHPYWQTLLLEISNARRPQEPMTISPGSRRCAVTHGSEVLEKPAIRDPDASG